MQSKPQPGLSHLRGRRNYTKVPFSHSQELSRPSGRWGCIAPDSDSQPHSVVSLTFPHSATAHAGAGGHRRLTRAHPARRLMTMPSRRFKHDTRALGLPLRTACPRNPGLLIYMVYCTIYRIHRVYVFACRSPHPPHKHGHADSLGRLVSPPAQVPHPRSDHPLVDIALLARLEPALGRLAPWADGVLVTL